MNASVRALLWTLAGCAGTSAYDSKVTPLGMQAVSAFDTCLCSAASRPVLVHNLFHWRLIASGWRSPQQQHDCVEYITHIGPKLCPVCLRGEWSARVDEAGVVVETEHAPTAQALSLEIPAGDTHRVQALIHHWHTQSSVHALRSPPEILLLRLVRYSLHVGGVHKNSAIVEWGDTLNMPCFSGELTCDSHNISYTVEAAILHAGQTITSGHYKNVPSRPRRVLPL